MHVPADNSTKPATTEYVRNQGFATKNELSNAVQKYLPLTGGTLNGNTTFASEIHLRPSQYPTIELGYIRAENIEKYKFVAMYANNGSANDPCGGFEAFASDCPSNPSGFNCRARGANNEFYDLAGRKDGSLKWYGKNIVRSVNGIDADTNGNVSIGKGVYLTGSWTSGRNWYRVYSDGWIGQGGFIANYPMSWTVANLLKAFATSNYTLLVATEKVNGGGYYMGYTVRNKTTNTFEYSTLDVTSVKGMIWHACGF